MSLGEITKVMMVAIVCLLRFWSSEEFCPNRSKKTEYQPKLDGLFAGSRNRILCDLDFFVFSNNFVFARYRRREKIK